MALDGACMRSERILTLLEADGVDDGLALAALQARLWHVCMFMQQDLAEWLPKQHKHSLWVIRQLMLAVPGACEVRSWLLCRQSGICSQLKRILHLLIVQMHLVL